LASAEARRFFSDTSRSSAAVEEDLDAALDDILGDAFKEAKDPIDMQPGTHMKHSRPISKNLVEEVRRPLSSCSKAHLFDAKLTCVHLFSFSGGSCRLQKSQISLYKQPSLGTSRSEPCYH